MTFPSSFTFFAEGTPRPQGSKRAFLRGGRIVLVEANPELKAWRETVALAAKMQIHSDLVHPSFDEPVGVQLLFVMPKPKTVQRDLPSVAPDLDKLCRAVFDALTDAQIWVDDSLACKLTGYCIYARFEMRSVRRELGLLKIRTGKLRLDVDETAGHLAKAVEVLSEASTETMKAVIDLRAGK